MKRFAATLALLAVCLVSAAAQLPGPIEGGMPPGLPSIVPPPAASAPAPTPTAMTSAIDLRLPQGWHFISFPFARVTQTSGFTHMLYRFAGGNYYAVDPNATADIDTRFGYVAYADAPTTVRIVGVRNHREVRSAPLEAGWNLLGCPSHHPLPWIGMTATASGTTRTLRDVAGGSDKVQWLSPTVYGFDEIPRAIQIDASGAALQPMQATWVLAYCPVRLHLHPGPPRATPHIDAVVPNVVTAGAVAEIQGNGLGKGGTVHFNGLPIAGPDVLTWSRTRIEFRLPTQAQTGPLNVTTSHLPSNVVTVTVSGAASGPATLMGQVQDSQGQPLASAQIMLDNGQATHSAADGSWLLAGVTAGHHVVYVTRLGYRTGIGQIEVAAGASKSILVSLSSTEAAPGVIPQGSDARAPQNREQHGTLYVVADAYDNGERHWWVSRIYVQEYQNGANHWENYWTSDIGDTSNELDCPNAVVGRTYSIDITWRPDRGGEPLHNMWYRKMYTAPQTVTFDSPY